MSIFRLFEGLDLCAPGDAASLMRACAGLAPDAEVLDAGCGRGADLPALLSLVPRGRVTAVDLSEAFIAHVRAHFPMVRAEVADMLDPPAGRYDLIWSGGAIYGPGIGPALRAWAPCLAAGGRVVFTDLVLRRPQVSPEVAAFFAEDGVALRDEAGLGAEIAAAGWRRTDGFWLPDTAWAAYYLPVEARLDALQDDPEMAEVVASFRREIALWRRHGGEYGYLLAVAVPQ
ncbi:class I SAM-dependent methyltransferase [Rhodobacter sp. Har01]|uniref:class I SAM-dependent methyltransferase n=1 Tax=Rhodobacter sp. Har01 TaxID=2883999 RepID=UPI001D089AD3|nr:class I SAM-dependent methyltransferase [Rhodobacter sp. Har01]MCB6177018.1 class I SAM-dependent methyltransferase [Rhodobacter sp. Har01]